MVAARCSFVIFAGLLGALSCTTNAKAKGPDDKSVSALGWIAGKWVLEAKGSRQEEVWTAPAGGSMIGMMRVTFGRTTIQREFNLMEETANGIFLTLGHVGPDMKFLDGWPVSLKLVKSSESEAVFEAEKPARIKSIFYRKTGQDEMLAGVEVDRNGSIRKIEFPMKREK